MLFRSSSISRPGSQATVLGQGGLLDAGVGIYEDLQAILTGRGGLQNVIGAVQKSLNVNQTLQKTPLSSIVRNDAQAVQQGVLRNGLPGAQRQVINAGNGIFFPQAPKV